MSNPLKAVSTVEVKSTEAGVKLDGLDENPHGRDDKPDEQDVCHPYQPSGDASKASLRERLDDVVGLSAIFKVLGDETRTRIIYLLSIQELCVCDIADVMEMSLPAVSHHLRLLKMARMVKSRREGKNVFYSLDDDHVLGLIRLAKTHYEEAR